MKLRFGAMVPSLREQIGFDLKNLDQYQKDADAIVRLFLRDLLSDSKKQECNRRLLKRIEKAILESEK